MDIQIDIKKIKILQIVYLVLPLIIFQIFWLKSIVQLIFVPIYLYASYRYIKSNRSDIDSNRRDIGSGQKQSYKLNIKLIELLICLILLQIWIHFQGVQHLTYQSADFFVRNPMYNDLIRMDWPLKYDLQKQAENVQNVIGSDTVMFQYYMYFWLVPSGICKILGITQRFTQFIVLGTWFYIGVILGWLLLIFYVKGNNIFKTLTFMFFCGFENIYWSVFTLLKPLGLNDGFLYNLLKPLTDKTYITICGNTDLFYNSFNQAVMLFILLSLTLLEKSTIGKLWLGSLIFVYSPFTIFGYIPILIVQLLQDMKFKKDNIVSYIKSLEFYEYLIPAINLIIFGAYYTCNSQSITEKGWIVNDFNNLQEGIICMLIFIVGNFLPFVLILNKRIINTPILLTQFIILTVIPWYKITPADDFLMRSQIPQLFIIMIAILGLIDELRLNNKKLAKNIVVAVFVIGALQNQMIESGICMVNSVGFDISQSGFVGDTFEKMHGQKGHIETVNNQFFCHDFDGKVFYKYIGKT